MSKHIAYISCDPGASGSFCLLVPETKHIEFYPTNVKPMDILEWFLFCAQRFNIRIVVIEEVHSIYGTSAKSNFSFGYNVGVVNALAEASGIGVDHMTPKAWQKIFGIRKKGKEIKKEVADICDRLYPKAAIRGPKGGLLDGRSDALAIAHVTSLKYNQI